VPGGVQLDVRLLEAEMVATPTELMAQSVNLEGNTVDGLELDADGNVVAYLVLKYHPGSNYRINNLQFSRVPANQIVHWFRPSRPGQHRGIAEVASPAAIWPAASIHRGGLRCRRDRR